MACQICLEDAAPVAENALIGGALCRRKCQARVCVSCLARHVQVTLGRCPEGLLPVVRCPVCVRQMRMDRWLRPLLPASQQLRTAKAITPLRSEYHRLCTRACSLTAPCCLNVYYSHLPSIWGRRSPPARPLRLLPSKVAAFRQAVARFCGHNLSAQALLAFSLDTFGAEDTRELVDRALPKISDDERRARLLLELLYQFPRAYTRCHGAAFCFACKRAGHHDECADTSLAGVDSSKFIVRCRNCHILVTKGDGCDTLECLCGHEMSFSTEVALQEQERARGRGVRANARRSGRVLVRSKIARRQREALFIASYVRTSSGGRRRRR